MRSCIVLILLLIVASNCAIAKNPLLEEWKRWKFGLFMHWGPYSILADDDRSNEASWPVNWASREWSNPDIQTQEQMIAYREYYFGLSHRFFPSKFDPSIWADAAQKAGMKYVVMTTKHHDGFNMYNTSLDEYSVVGSECPYKRDIYGDVVKAFRKRGFGIGAYYSKVDWHRKDYWKDEPFADTKYTNYDPAKEPNLWNSFRSYTQKQVSEIVRKYNPDILWFDGGWAKPVYMDLRMDQIVEDARSMKKDIIVVNRGGRMFEDYLTPEQHGIPDVPVNEPWELCMTMGDHWSFEKNDTYKSTPEILQILLTVVARGGNLLLNIGPKSDGTFHETPMSRLQELGEWMKVNSEAIHDTIPVAPYNFETMISPTESQQYYLTRKDRAIYVTLFAKSLPNRLLMPFITEGGLEGLSIRIKHAELLGSSVALLPVFLDKTLVIHLPKYLHPPCKHAFTFKLTE